MNLRHPRLIAFTIAGLLAAGGCRQQPAGHDHAAPATATVQPEVSGRLEGGLRIVTLDPAQPATVVRVYRGDYVQLELPGGEPFTVTVDSLRQSWTWPVPEGGKPYLKMSEAGSYAFTAGPVTGTFEVIEYQAAAYRELRADEAAKIIANLEPLVLDVRTPGEFAGGHLEGALLVPIQQMQARLGELAAHRDGPVFIYCQTGNRSTVAAKLLIDAGFTNVMNLRRGIVEWKSAGLPVVK
ncbi:MAG: rhodanese-like domain-containing protein [bacterium]|nr:rhodanese-like domain-containing protein [bacterium]